LWHPRPLNWLPDGFYTTAKIAAGANGEVHVIAINDSGAVDYFNLQGGAFLGGGFSSGINVFGAGHRSVAIAVTQGVHGIDEVQIVATKYGGGMYHYRGNLYRGNLWNGWSQQPIGNNNDTGAITIAMSDNRTAHVAVAGGSGNLRYFRIPADSAPLPATEVAGLAGRGVSP
jgi:hypothetical protein